VRDQDTLALTRESDEKKSAFSWQFRPVLGQPYVKSGLKQTFVQYALPTVAKSDSFGNLKVKTYWQKYDRKRGVLKEVIPGSVVEYTEYTVPVFDTSPMIEDVAPQDLRDGNLVVGLKGRFVTGTYVRVGPNLFRVGGTGFTHELDRVRFAASAFDIARHGAFLVNRDGTETPIIYAFLPPASRPRASSTVTAFDSANSLVTVCVEKFETAGPQMEHHYIVINGKVFGFADSPIERVKAGNGARFTAVVPNSLLLSSPSIEIKPLFFNPGFEPLVSYEFGLENVADKIVALGKLANGKTRYLLYGHRLKYAEILIPEKLAFTPPYAVANEDTVRAFDLTTDEAGALKNIVLLKAGDIRPVFVPMPMPEPKPTVTSKTRIAAGTDELVVTSDHFDKLKGIKFKTVDVLEGHVRDKSNITLRNLRAKGVTAGPGMIKLEFDFGDAGKFALEIEVVSGKVELLLPGQ